MVKWGVAAVFSCILCCLIVGYWSITTSVATDVKDGNIAVGAVVWGPGLNADASLPVRYFFIQAVDLSGKNLTRSAGSEAFDVRFQGLSGEHVVAWRDILDRKDGTYVARYRLVQQQRGLSISVLARGGQHITGSPFVLSGILYQENCYCPEDDVQKVLASLQCNPSGYSQIRRDLERFNNKPINMTDTLQQVESRFNQRRAYSLAHYVIKHNKIHRKTYGEYVGFKMFSDGIFLSLARKVRLPDVEFVINLGDWPLERNLVSPIPIFSWCGSDSTADIVMPTYDITESTLMALNRVSLDMLSIQGNTGPIWEDKTEKGFWRGRDSRQERLDLVVLARKHNNSELLDAAMTNFFFFPYDKVKYGPKNQHVSFFDFFKHKYQVNVDGTVAAYRFPYLLAGDSVVLKQNSQFYEHFYKDLVPWKHYIPLDEKLSDVLEKIQWAKENDEEARNIGKRGQTYARENLTPNHILCYHIELLQEYAKLLTHSITILKDMEEVAQPDEEAACVCQRISHSIHQSTASNQHPGKKEEL